MDLPFGWVISNLRIVFSRGEKMQIKNFLAERIIRCLLVFLMVLAICKGLQTTVAAQNLIPLQPGGPHAGSWESSDVFLEYQFVVQQGTFKINIGGKAKRGYDQLSVWIKFFDAQGKVLEKKSVFNSGFRRKLLRGKDRIEKTFEMPASSTQFAFHSMLMDRQGK
jgi:hypothetical protein